MRTSTAFSLASVGLRFQRLRSALSCTCLSVKSLQSVGCVPGLFCCSDRHLSAGRRAETGQPVYL